MADLLDRRVPPEKLRATFDPASLSFDCTDELSPLTEFVGQDRAIRSLQFGLGMHKPGYNIFVTGMTGTGRATAILEYIERRIRNNHETAALQDWCYVYNFDEPDLPRALALPSGTGKRLRDALDQLLTRLRANLAQAFTSEDYERQRRQVAERSQEQAQELMEKAGTQAQAAGFALTFLPTGPNLIPLHESRPMTPDEYQALTPDQRRDLADKQKPVNDLVSEVGEKLRAMERELVEEIQQFDRQIVEALVKTPFDALTGEFAESSAATGFLEALRAFTLRNADALRQMATAPPTPELSPAAPVDPFLAFRVNVIVDNSGVTSPLIIVEANPTWTNLFGRIERRAFMGTYLSDHTMLRPGAFHRANGGYLILNFADVTAKPGAWDGVKRAIRTREVRLEDPLEQFGAMTPQALRPEPIPLDVKVVMTGEPLSYFLLSAYDPDAWELFKVKADFDHQVTRSLENAVAYAQLACTVSEREHIRHFDRSAVARLVEHGSRLVEDQEKLSARFGQLRDIVIEADYWAAQEGTSRVLAHHVDRAIDEKHYRINLLEDRVQEMIERGSIMIDTEGVVVGQVNGLVVMSFGDLSFGRPSRITARTYLGQRGIVSIDRESQLSGKIHDKGLLTLSGYFGWKYGQERPLSLSATISFEQGYDPVDGDSATIAETCAILSALADVPVRQDIAITGSMNQAGEVQPIGGVNDKIEGFFDVCKAVGLTGQQGVIIPATNVKNLMLRRDVVEASAAGQFTVYEVHTIDEAIEILTGTPAGEKSEDGTYPEGTIHQLVDAKLKQMGEALRKSGQSEKKDDKFAEAEEERSEAPPEDPPPEPNLPA